MWTVSYGLVSGLWPGCGAIRWNAFPGYESCSEQDDAHWETFWETRHFGVAGSSDSAWRNCVHHFVWGTLARREMSAGWAPDDESTQFADVWSVNFGE